MAERPRDTYLPGQGDGREFVDLPNRNMPPPREPRPYDSPRWPAKPEPVQVSGYEPQRPHEPKINTANLTDWRTAPALEQNSDDDIFSRVSASVRVALAARGIPYEPISK